jgi:hypothetical protein
MHANGVEQGQVQIGARRAVGMGDVASRIAFAAGAPNQQDWHTDLAVRVVFGNAAVFNRFRK